MHDGPQVQDDGRSDVTVKEDSRGEVVNCDERPEISYWCNRCNSSIGPRKKNPEKYISHEEHVRKCWSNGKLGIDYVECALCRFAGCKIAQHVKLTHDMSKENYVKKYGSLISQNSSKRYGATENCDWINRRKNEGKDLSEYKLKIASAVSTAIMSNPDERARRASLLGTLNKRQDFRDKSSRTAKVTSSRPDVIANRTGQLKRWRREHPEKFQATIEKALKITSSRPEKLLFEICKEILGNDTISQFKIQHPLIPTKSHRARIDIANKNLKVLIELDGPFHFKPIVGEEHLSFRRVRDLAVEKYAIENGYVLIRISYDLFDGKKFDESVSNCLREVSNMKSCVVKIGSWYCDENSQVDVI
jgi:very-short-patch-repair endonuclease